jgi:hypothetical protein
MNPITAEKSKLGFVGVGYMGRPIAQRLLASSFKLIAGTDKPRGNHGQYGRKGNDDGRRTRTERIASGSDMRPAVSNSSRLAALLARTAKGHGGGPIGTYKTTHQFDGTFANPQWLG